MQQNELISLAIKGDAAAIEQLYNTYKKPVFFLALKLMGNGKDAADVLQYAFFQAFHRLKSLKKPDKFEEWLYVIASNRCTMLLKEKDPIHFAVSESETQKVKFNIPNTPVKTSVADDEAARVSVSQIIDKMPDITRISVMMYFYGLQDVNQIKKVIHIDEELVKKYIDEGVERINAEIDSLKGQKKALESYKNIGELHDILHRCAEDSVIAGELDNAILNTSKTIVLASLNSLPEIPYVQVSNEEQEISEDNTVTVSEPGQTDVPHESKQISEKKKAAVRNLILIAVILILAVGIIVTSVMMLRELARNSSGVNPDESKAPVSESETVEKINPNTEDESVTDSEITETEPPVTETEHVETVPPETEPVQTMPPETAPVETDPPVNGDSISAAEASKLYVCRTNADNTVTISTYKGAAKEVDIPGKIDGKPVTVIGANAFNGNTSIVSVNIPDTVTKIDGGAFTGCTALTSVHLPSNLREIGEYAFRKCSSLANIKVPSTVTKVGLTAFGETAWMNAQPAGFVVVGDGVLVRYTGTDADVIIPDTVKHIANAFYYNSSVKTITVSESVKTIGQYAFCACGKLTKISLSSSVSEIAPDAIYQCGSLGAISAPAGSYSEKWINTIKK